MPYQITTSDGTLLTLIQDNTVNNSVTPLSLFGHGITTYGAALDENFVYILENFANSVAPLNPIRGQLWFDTSGDNGRGVLNMYATPSGGSGFAWIPLLSGNSFGSSITVTDSSGDSATLNGNGILVLERSAPDDGPAIWFQTVPGESEPEALIKQVGVNVQISPGLNVEGDSYVSGNFSVGGVSNNASLNVTGVSTIGSLLVTGQTQLGATSINQAFISNSTVQTALDSGHNVTMNPTGILSLTRNNTNDGPEIDFYTAAGQVPVGFLKLVVGDVPTGGSTPSYPNPYGYLEVAYGLDVLGNANITGSLTVNGVNVLDAGYLPLTGGTLTGDLILADSDLNDIRFLGGSCSIILRYDGASFYILGTNPNDPNGSYTSYRPFAFNPATGQASMDTVTLTNATISASGTVSVAQAVTNGSNTIGGCYQVADLNTFTPNGLMFKFLDSTANNTQLVLASTASPDGILNIVLDETLPQPYSPRIFTTGNFEVNGNLSVWSPTVAALSNGTQPIFMLVDPGPGTQTIGQHGVDETYGAGGMALTGAGTIVGGSSDYKLSFGSANYTENQLTSIMMNLELSTGNLAVVGSVSSNGIVLTSDARMKSDIMTFGDSLEVVNQLRGVSFTHNKTGAADIGVIAQEVQEVLPQLVKQDQDGMLSVSYPSLIGVLIEAIKELTGRVAELEEKLK